MPERYEDLETSWSGSPEWTAQSIQTIVDPTKKPTAEQIAVIESPLQPTLVVAGAGAGKTETMSMRVLWLVANQGIAPERILGLTFTRKAAGELAERLRARLSVLGQEIPQIVDCEPPTVSTYNSFAQRIVKEHGWRLGYAQDVRLIGSAAALQLLTTIVREADPDELPDLALSTIVAECHALSQKISEHCLTFDSARQQMLSLQREIEVAGAKKNSLFADAANAMAVMERRLFYLDIIESFAQRKRQMGVIDFADQLAIANTLVTEYDEVVQVVRGEFDAVLLDEFQDTSFIQMQLFSRIFGSHVGKRLAVTAVGDPNQAIYGWRGASSASLEDFISSFDMDGEVPALTDKEQERKSRSQTLSLSTAWRNDKQILFAANVLAAPLSHLSERVPVKPLEARPGAGAGAVRCHYLSTPTNEAEYVAEQMENILKEWQQACQDAQREGQESPKRPSMAVLAKRRKDFERFNRALQARGIPTQVFDSGGLLDHPIIKRLVAALRVCHDVSDAKPLIYLIDKLRLGASDMSLLWSWAQQQNTAQKTTQEKTSALVRHATLLMEAVDTPPGVGWQANPDGPAFTQVGYERVATLGSRLRALRAVSAHGIEDYVERAISIMGLVQDSLADHVISDGRDVIDAFLDIVIDYAKGNEWADIPGFLTWLDIAAEEERGLPTPSSDPIEGAVHIMTVHGSKGLEWDVVAVIGMSDGAFPQHRSTSKNRTLVEHPGYYSVSDNDLWSENGWVTQAKELPYEMRGDRKVLPGFAPELYLDGVLTEKPMSYPQWFKNVFKVSVGQHQEREQRRLAYVAVTRARNTLLMTGNWLDTPKGRAPSIYLREVLQSLCLRALEETPSEAPTPELRQSWRESWMAAVPLAQRRHLHQRWTALIEKWKDINTCVEQAQESLAAETDSKPKVYYPAPPTSAQLDIERGAHSVTQAARTLEGSIDVTEVLNSLGDNPMVRNALAVIAEHRKKAQHTTHPITLSALSATSVASLLADVDAFALQMRRPLPMQPSASASLGTLVHAWVERQLRQLTGELWDDPLDGIERLSEVEERRLKVMQENFNAYTLPGRIAALEELFALTIYGVTIQGRIDAIFSDEKGDIIVDWKSGKVPHRNQLAKIRYFRDQLYVYQHAWAARSGRAPEQVRAQLYFLEYDQTLTLETLNEWLQAAGENSDMSTELAHALNIDD